MKLLILLALAVQAGPSFDVASVKPTSASGPTARFHGGLQFTPGRVHGDNVPARRLILAAYGITSYQLAGGPSWLDSDGFDVDAKAASGADTSELRLMLQTLLAERFHLTLRHETKETPVFVVTVGKGGIKLPEYKPGSAAPPPPLRRTDAKITGNMFTRGTVAEIIESLSGNSQVGRPVIDKTGLTGTYTLYLAFYEDEDFLQTIETASGLKFESQKAPLDVFTIEHIEKPTGN